ncbi:MAG: phage holin family protein [Myxococcales bacterium]
MPDQGTSSKDALQQLLDGLQTFIREHLALARVEMKEDLRGLGRDLMVGAAGVPALAAGYLLLMMAVGYLLAVWLPAWAAFGIVAAVNLALGGILTWSGTRRAMEDRVELSGTATEIRRDREWLASLSKGPGAAKRAGGRRPAALSQPGGQPTAAPPGMEGTHA